MLTTLVVLAALGTVCLPLFVRGARRVLPSYKFYAAVTWLPVAAAATILVSVFIPDVHISNETSTFQQHFVGGGVYASLLFMYAKQLFGWRFHWFVELCLLFAWVSALGVAVELGEFALIKFGIKHIHSGDTDWDLLANTLGGFVGYISERGALRVIGRRSKVVT